MSCPVPGLAELFEKPLKKISFPRELEKKVYLYSYHFLKKNPVKGDTTEQKTKKEKCTEGNVADKNNVKKKKSKKKKKKKTCKKNDGNVNASASEEVDYNLIQKNDGNINSENDESNVDENPSLMLPDKKTINTHKWPIQSKKDEIPANSRHFENVANVDFDLVGSLLGGNQSKPDFHSPSINVQLKPDFRCASINVQLKSDFHSPSINILKRKRKTDEDILKHIAKKDKVDTNKNNVITGNQDKNNGITTNQDMIDVITKAKQSENAISNTFISDEVDPSKRKQFEDATQHLSTETLNIKLVTDINNSRFNEEFNKPVTQTKEFINPVTYNEEFINPVTYNEEFISPVVTYKSNDSYVNTTPKTTVRSCEYMYNQGNRSSVNEHLVNEQSARRNTRSMSRGLSQHQNNFKAESNWSETLMDLVAGSPMETEVISSSRESSKHEVIEKPKRKKKSKKSMEASKEYWAKRRVEMQREKEKREHDATVPCVYYKKHGECNYGDECRFSHDIEVDIKKRDCCKYYVAGACFKGNDCRFLHGEWPCKFFHKSRFCSHGDNCKFSHAQMTPEIKELFDARILYEESLKKTEKSNTNPEVCLQDIKCSVVDEMTGEAAEKVNEEKYTYDNTDSKIEETQHSPKTVQEFQFPSLYYELS